MYTYQDFQQVDDNDVARLEFVKQIIAQHEGSDLYKTAKIADDYDRQQNTTIMNYDRTLTTVSGRIVKDQWSPNHKMATNFFHVAVTQLVQYLLGNGVTWKDGFDAARLGGDFDNRIQEIGKYAVKSALAFGFFNYDHVETFPIYDRDRPNFAPVQDEENGGFRAGVRYWGIEGKNNRGTLYTEDGVTEYIWNAKDDFRPTSAAWQRIAPGCWVIPRRPYKTTVLRSDIDGERIYAGENYPAFPIVPMWGNSLHQSELVGKQESIDAYDLILNGFENDLDTAQLYWVIKGAGGMDNADLAEFLHRLYTTKAVAPGDGQEVAPVQVQIPYAAREALLDRLERQLYKDAMLLNPYDISGGAATATQILASYEPQNVKADDFEYCVLDFIQGILQVAGLTGEASFTRSVIVNASEELQNVISAAEFTGAEYTTRKILTLLGDGDQADEIIRQMQEAEMARGGMTSGEETGTETETEGEENA